ncbi:PepSY-like domain-containing protein [Niabella aurantiaca]|uniref:PepSY-like domain-containing protein n=1 Tax=Niabella aurantiaca TaxID=379900 RepID=UPI00037D771F|nr:PepSY-like domain-containing protein [Niabella aurantiaca]
MKAKLKLSVGAALIAVAAFFGSKSAAQETPITRSQLPKAAQAFLTKYFPGQEISRIIRDKELMRTEYEVYLANSVKAEFDGNGAWKEVESKQQPLPVTFIPSNITRHISANFPAQKIIKVEKTKAKYEVELSNGMDLDFNAKGNFLRVDD